MFAGFGVPFFPACLVWCPGFLNPCRNPHKGRLFADIRPFSFGVGNYAKIEKVSNTALLRPFVVVWLSRSSYLKIFTNLLNILVYVTRLFPISNY